MKKILKKQDLTLSGNFILEKITIKEIMEKYPDKVVDVYAQSKDAILLLDTCRIRFVNTKTEPL